LTSGHSDAQS